MNAIHLIMNRTLALIIVSIHMGATSVNVRRDTTGQTKQKNV